jgi:hypothetical protein
MAGLVQRQNACLTSKLRGFDSCTRHQSDFVSREAQLAERAIDNREAVGSTPTPWTILERASPSGKAPGFQPGSAWVRIPPPAPASLGYGASAARSKFSRQTLKPFHPASIVLVQESEIDPITKWRSRYLLSITY